MCSTGACCDGCNYRPNTYECRSAGSWTCNGGKCGQRRRESAANCPGTSASCPVVTYEYDTINSGKVCSGGSEVDATSSTLACDNSVDYWATAGQCTYTKRYAECDGAGNCDTDASHHYSSTSYNVPNSKVAKSQSGGTGTPYQDATSTVNTGTWENCNNAFCSANKRYYECYNGASSTSYYTQVIVTAQDGYTLTNTCGTQGTTPCGSTLCAADTCTGATYNDYPFTGSGTQGGCNKFCSSGSCAACSTTSGVCAPSSETCSATKECDSAASNCGGGTVEKCRYSNSGSWEWVTSLGTETACSDGKDNDCQGGIDIADSTSCCTPSGSSSTCSADANCCGTTTHCSKINPSTGASVSPHCCDDGYWWNPNKVGSNKCQQAAICTNLFNPNPFGGYRSGPPKQGCCTVIVGDSRRVWQNIQIY